jgi:mannitol-1-/sugar-/sorbitol-6-phosphatase
MVTITVQGFLFDMDGVLVSSIGSVERSWAKWGEMRGVETAKVVAASHGKRAIETIRLLRPDLPEMEELALIEDLECADVEDTLAIEGVQPFLAKLPPERWTIVTSATGRLARLRLETAGIAPPERFISAEMVEHGKPHPEPYERGAALLGLPPAECLVVEDAPAGAEAGHAAGAQVLTTLFSHTPEQLKHADWIVRSLAEVDVAVSAAGITLRFEPVARAKR